mgnify:CR=1 FL=1
MATSTARLFAHGRSQAVRLPKEFRFPGKEVRILTADGDKETMRVAKIRQVYPAVQNGRVTADLDAATTKVYEMLGGLDAALAASLNTEVAKTA